MVRTPGCEQCCKIRVQTRLERSFRHVGTKVCTHIEKICSPHFRDFGNGLFEQISRFFFKVNLSIPEFRPEFRKIPRISGRFSGIDTKQRTQTKGLTMQRKDPKCRCEKRVVEKSTGVCKLYSKLQSAYLDILQNNDSIETIQCNVPLDGFSQGDYTTDFLCKCKDGTFMVRECVERKYLTKPMTISLLDASRLFWAKREITNWGIVTNTEGSYA